MATMSSYGTDTLSSEKELSQAAIMETPKPYGLPHNYNPTDFPPVIMRQKTHNDSSETQRKRRSKNRLSNRRSTGFVPREDVDAAKNLGNNGQITTETN